MDDKQPIIVKRSTVKSTENGIEYRALPSIQKAANDPNHPGHNEAKAILFDWYAAQKLPEPSRTKNQIQVRKHMMKFVRQYPI